MRCLPLVLALLGAGCVFNPKNDARYASTVGSVFVSGYGTSAGQQFEVLAASSPSGPFTVIGGPLSAASDPVTTASGDFYPFSGYVVVPSSNWAVQGCDSVAYLRVRPVNSSFYAYTFDRYTADGQLPESCVLAALEATGNALTAASTCASPSSPTLRITAPAPGNRYVGSLSLSSAADVAERSCLQEITGTLTISSAIAADVTLPRLREIGGDLRITYPVRPTPGFGIQDQNYDRAFPALTTVRDDVLLSATAAAGDYIDLDINMPALTRIDGDLEVTLVAPVNKSVRGLPALTRLGGSLIVEAPGNDFTALGFLPTLNRIDGSLALAFGNPQPVGVLSNLRTVSGSVDVTARFFGTATLAALETVGGNLTLQGSPSAPTRVSGSAIGRVFGDLRNVGGTLALRFLDGLVRTFDVGGAGLTAGALTIQSTQQTSFSSATVMVVGPGQIRIENNSALCTSAINAFLLGQTSWTGSSVVSGNGGC